MDIQPIAYFESPLKSKFGIPRQSGLAGGLTGRIVFVQEYRQREAVRGMEDFDYLWLIWEFSANGSGKWKEESGKRNLTVRPPRLGGNCRMGVFATRSPFRPNNLGLSCVRLERVEEDAKLGPVIYVRGADLMDGTPIYDIKPYVAYADSHPHARSGFVDNTAWQPLGVDIPEAVERCFTPEELEALRQLLALDPRPQYHDDPERVYGFPFGKYDIRFRVSDGTLHVLDAVSSSL